MKKAFSYIRFSREHQSRGDSLRRQLKETQDYCIRNGLELDETLDLKDFGVSGWTGQNEKAGALGRFLQACGKGIIPEGSALVVESLDRLSRQSPRKTVRLLTEILDEHKIEIHLTQAGKVFRPEVDEGVDLIIAVAMSMRSHEESETKSKRLLAVWEQRRKKAAEGAILASVLPWWLEFKMVRGKKIIICPKDREKVIKRIFEETLAGKSSAKIARQFNKDKIPTWRPKAKIWQAARIRDIIRSDAVLGTLTETAKTRAAGRRHKIENQYPVLIDEITVFRAREIVLQNQKGIRGKEADPTRLQHLFRGLLRYKDVWMSYNIRKNGEGGSWNGYYLATDPLTGKVLLTISGRQLEPVILQAMFEIRKKDIYPDENNNKRIQPYKNLNIQKNILQQKIENLLGAIESGSKSVAARLVKMEEELAAIEKTLKTITPLTSYSISQEFNTGVLDVRLDDLLTRKRITLSMRQIVSKIEVQDYSYETEEWGGRIQEDPKLVTAFENADWGLVPDPVENNKRRKPLLIVIHFKDGTYRFVMRPPKYNVPQEIDKLWVS